MHVKWTKEVFGVFVDGWWCLLGSMGPKNGFLKGFSGQNDSVTEKILGQKHQKNAICVIFHPTRAYIMAYHHVRAIVVHRDGFLSA